MPETFRKHGPGHYIARFYAPKASGCGPENCKRCTFHELYCKGTFPAQQARCIASDCNQECGFCFGGEKALIPGVCGKLPEATPPVHPEKVHWKGIPKTEPVKGLNNLVMWSNNSFMASLLDAFPEDVKFGMSMHLIPNWLPAEKRARIVLTGQSPDHRLEQIWYRRTLFSPMGFHLWSPPAFSDYINTPMKHFIINWHRILWYMIHDGAKILPLSHYDKAMRIIGPAATERVLSRVGNVQFFFGIRFGTRKKLKSGDYDKFMRAMAADLRGWNSLLTGQTAVCHGVNNPKMAEFCRKILTNAGELVFTATQPAILAVKSHVLNPDFSHVPAPHNVPKEELLRQNVETYLTL